jgi:hypothetical protein
VIGVAVGKAEASVRGVHGAGGFVDLPGDEALFFGDGVSATVAAIGAALGKSDV